MKELARKILGCGHDIAKNVQLIEVVESELRHDRALNKPIEIGEVADHSSLPIRVAAYCDLDLVIVPVPVRVIALAIDLPILLLGELWRMQSMRG
jgi:hypothetical protein